MSIATPIPHAPAPEGAMVLPIEHSKATSSGLRLAHLWAILPFALAWFVAATDYIEPFDFWWNVKSGQIMAETGRFLGSDVLVWSPVRLPYSNPQWGSQLLFYWIYSISPYLLLTLRALIMVATLGMIMRLCVWRSGSLRAASLATLVAYFTGWTNYGIRPQLLAFLPFMAFMFILERKDTHPKWLMALPPIMLFWVNVHGSFFLGVALMGLYALGTLLERLGSHKKGGRLLTRAMGWQALWFGVATLTTLLNPYTTDIYRYFFIATNDPIARSLNIEWQPPTLYDGTGILFYANVLILLVSLYLSKRRLRPTEILLMLAFGYLSLTSLRNVMWWGWVTAPILASNLALWSANRRAAKEATDELARPANARAELPALNCVLTGIMIGGALLFTPLWREANPLVAQASKTPFAAGTPTKLAEFLKRSNLPAPLLNYMEWGGYLEWQLYPRYQMFIDGRFEARQVQVWKDYLSVSRGRADWQKTLDQYRIKTLVLNKSFQGDLIPLLAASGAWHKVYEDQTGVVYTR